MYLSKCFNQQDTPFLIVLFLIFIVLITTIYLLEVMFYGAAGNATYAFQDPKFKKHGSMRHAKTLDTTTPFEADF
jgi:hypothetical protein